MPVAANILFYDEVRIALTKVSAGRLLPHITEDGTINLSARPRKIPLLS
ncbi:hypothetical protein KCP75_03950 [Salmonella enterica subsp. enterica]|nr:hypothetical protein KCP75_03950 [Salmonella enterica subsp. enterica]